MCQMCDAVLGTDRDGIDSNGNRLEDINPAAKDGDMHEVYNTLTKKQVAVIKENPDLASMIVKLAEDSYKTGYKDAMGVATGILLDVVLPK